MAVSISRGAKFTSLDELKSAILLYCDENKVDLHIYTSRTLLAAKKLCPAKVEKADPTLIYYNLDYRCKQGIGSVRKNKDGIRQSPVKKDCPFRIYVTLASDGASLDINYINEEHNHEVSEELYAEIKKHKPKPRQRKTTNPKRKRNYVPESETSSENSEKLWGGRFQSTLHPLMEKFNSSITFDKELYAADIKGSFAYAKALKRCGILSEDEHSKISSGLIQVLSEWSSGSFVIKADEDVHSANERRLKEICGSDIGGMLHTGRSRNDQVSTDVRLWMLEKAQSLKTYLINFIEVFCKRAKNEIDVLMPGYTHLQRAQTIRWSHWLLSHAWYFYNDVNKLEDIIKRTSVCPLGSGALAGNPFPIDRDYLAQELGFSFCTQNSLYAVSDRDFIADFLFWGALVGTHFSKFAEDLLLYSTKEFGFVTIADEFSTGSSLMPQKKNADSLELIRAKSGRLAGNCMNVLVVLKGLPSAFNKDLQEDKEPLFDTYKTLVDMVRVATGTLDTLTVHKEACQKALSADMFATDVAYYLVRKGVSFRDAHGVAGKVVSKAEQENCNISELSLFQLQEISVLFQDDVSSLWNYENSVEQYHAVGGTAKKSVLQQITKLEEWISVNAKGAQPAVVKLVGPFFKVPVTK